MGIRPRLALSVTMLSGSLLLGCSSGPPAITPDVHATPASLPAGWAYLSWTDPRWEVALPGDWSAQDPTATEVPDPSSSLEPIQQRNIDFANQMAMSSATHFIAYGSIAGQQGGGLYVFVECGDASMDAFVDREIQLDKTLVDSALVVDRTIVVVAAGSATRLSYAGQIADWPRFSEDDYLFRLPDGRSLTIGISGTDTAADPATLASFASQVIATLKPVP